MTNISSDRKGRLFIVRNIPNFLTKIRNCILSKNKERRISSLKTLRNLAFEFEEKEFVKGFLDSKITDFLLVRTHQIIKDSVVLPPK